MRLESLHRIPVIKDIMPKLPMDEDYVIINESISFEPTDEYFSIGGKEFHEEGSDVYNIYANGLHVGMLAISEYPDGIKLDGLEIFEKYRKQGFGKRVVDLLKKKYKGIYVRAIPSAKKFWQKQGHQAYYNKDAGTYDGDLIYDSDKLENLNESIAYAEMNDDEMMVILHNPTRKELKDNNLDDECRIIYDGNNGYYFASSEWTHEQIEQKLQANNLPYSETSGEFYYYQDNLFTTRDDWSSEEEYQEYKNDWYQSLKSMPYIVKNFGNFKVEIFKGEYLNEELIYAERSDDYYDDSEYQDMTNVILKNPSRKELIDNGMIECRIVKDYKDNFYFANSYEMIHTDIVDKLESENITSVETNLFYDVNSNTFYYNVGHLADNEIKDFSQREEQMLRTSSYVSKTFKNFKFKLTYGEM